MNVTNRKVWSTSEDNTTLLTLDTKIVVHVYEVSPTLLGQVMRAGLMVLQSLAINDEHPLSQEAKRALSEWHMFLPASWRPDHFPTVEAEAELAATPHGQPLTQGTAEQERPA